MHTCISPRTDFVSFSGSDFLSLLPYSSTALRLGASNLKHIRLFDRMDFNLKRRIGRYIGLDAGIGVSDEDTRKKEISCQRASSINGTLDFGNATIYDPETSTPPVPPYQLRVSLYLPVRTLLYCSAFSVIAVCFLGDFWGPCC